MPDKPASAARDLVGHVAVLCAQQMSTAWLIEGQGKGEHTLGPSAVHGPTTQPPRSRREDSARANMAELRA